MTEGTAGESQASTASPDSSASLADDLGAMFGDFSGSESPESSTDSGSGAPPDADDSVSDPAQIFADGSEGAGTAEHAGTPPAVAAETPPDTQGSSSLDDPLKDATPFTYTVNGQQRTADGIKRLGDHGAIVDADYLPKLERIFTERDHLFEKSQADYQETSALKSQLEALTTWTYTDKQGQPQKLTGEQGLFAHRMFAARAFEKARIFEETLKDPQRLFELLAQDEHGALVVNPKEWASLEQRIENATLKLDQPVRQNLPKLTGVAPQTPPAPEASVESLAMGTVDAIAQQLNVTGFTPEDKAFLAAQLPRYVRATTPEEQRLGQGSRIVDHAFTALVHREAQRIANASKLVTTATTTAAENAARLAAAARGQRPVATAARSTTPATPTPRPVPQAESNRDAMWDRMERAQAAVSRRSA